MKPVQAIQPLMSSKNGSEFVYKVCFPQSKSEWHQLPASQLSCQKFIWLFSLQLLMLGDFGIILNLVGRLYNLLFISDLYIQMNPHII